MYLRSAHSNGVQGLSSFRYLIVLAILLLAIQSVEGLALDVNAPESVKEGETLHVNFTSDPNADSYFIFRNDVLVSTTQTYSWITGNSDAGTYTFKFLANSTNESAEQEKIIDVLDVPLIVTINEPQTGVVTNGEIRISVSSPEATQCTYELEGVASGNLIDNGNEWYKNLLLSQDKIYNLNVSCVAGSDTGSNTVIFILDTTPPVIESKEPDGSFTGTPVPITIETNENSICKYSTSDISYNEMQEFSQTGGVDHIQISNIQKQQDMTYYVQCEDRHGNIMGSKEEITFFANLKPTAEIRIENDEENYEDLLKPGTYQIEIITSEPVLEPTLEYEFSNERLRKEIPLEGHDQRWEGFIAIKESIENDVGTFFFSSTDMTDLEGKEITKGKIFLVDTQAPDIIENMEVNVNGIDAELEWYYEGETADDFYIYRDIEPEVDYLDKYAETPHMEFVDNSVLLGEKYYYRVAAVDKAGNVGPLSDEKSIIIEIEIQEEISPEILRNLENAQELLQRNVFDVDQSISRLESERNYEKLEVIRHLDLTAKAKEAKKKIETLINEIEKLKLVSLTEGEAKQRISVFLQNSDLQMKQVADSITIVDSARLDQSLLEEDLDEAINEVLVGLKLSADARESYKSEMRRIQDKTTVSLEGITARIDFKETVNPSEITLVQKKIITEEPLLEAMIVEIISKGYARRDSEISFKEKPSVLKPDPIVKWEFATLTSKDISYYVEKIVDLAEVKNSKTVLLTKPKPEVVENKITGEVIAEPEIKESLWSRAIFFIGLITLIGLLVYYMAFSKEGKIHQRHKIMPKTRPLYERGFAPKTLTRETRKPKQPRKGIEVYHHVKKAHKFADDVRYEEALELYKNILNHLEKAEVDPKVREKLDIEIQKLYDKIMLVNHIERAHNAIDNKKPQDLKQSLIEIKKAYRSLSEETELAMHTRKNYSYLIKNMKGFDQEEFFKNL